jgi:drug/metabolite transporter superfamily protein YnfA
LKYRKIEKYIIIQAYIIFLLLGDMSKPSSYDDNNVKLPKPNVKLPNFYRNTFTKEQEWVSIGWYVIIMTLNYFLYNGTLRDFCKYGIVFIVISFLYNTIVMTYNMTSEVSCLYNEKLVLNNMKDEIANEVYDADSHHVLMSAYNQRLANYNARQKHLETFKKEKK